MPIITYIEHNGAEHAVAVKAGMSVMEGAIQNSVPGINADCGGACACATCHVYINDRRVERAATISMIEEAMLQLVNDAEPTSRLACQVVVNNNLDGLVVRLPENQGSRTGKSDALFSPIGPRQGA